MEKIKINKKIVFTKKDKKIIKIQDKYLDYVAKETKKFKNWEPL